MSIILAGCREENGQFLEYKWQNLKCFAVLVHPDFCRKQYEDPIQQNNSVN